MQKTIDWDRRFIKQAEWTLNLRNYLYNRVGLKQLNHIIEIGCGTGAILDDFGDEKDKQIFGLDISEKFIRFAKQKNAHVSLTIGDAHSLPFKECSFDIVLCHFFLLWIRDPVLVLNEMQRIAGRDGIILVLAEPDYGGRLDYPDELEKLGAAQIDSLKQQGADPFIGRRLGNLFKSSGITLLEMGILGGQWAPRQLEDTGDEEWQMLVHDLLFISQGLGRQFIESSELTKLKEIHTSTTQTGERVLFIPTFYAWGKVNK